jgi:RecB family exonuclease
MASIINVNDISKEVNRFYNKGLIKKEELDQIEKLIDKIVHHEELKTYFRSGKTVFTEREIITKDKQILIPDRLVFNDKNEVIIIDYKTGKPDKKHHEQIKRYGRVLETMNYIVSERILVYIDNEITVIKV